MFSTPPRQQSALGLSLLVVLLLALLVGAGGAPAQAQSDCVTMTLDPLTSDVRPGAMFSVVVRLNSPTRTFGGADFDLRFNPAVLQVVTSAGVPATVVEQGDLGGLAAVNQVDNTNGRVRYAEALLGGEKSGSFILATIRFRAIGAGGTSSELRFAGANAASVSSPTSILCAQPANGSVTVLADTPTPTPTATRTPPPLPPPPVCPNLLSNSSFESNLYWTHPATPRTAVYTTREAYEGSRSMQHGIVPPAGDVYAHSSAYQVVTIPAAVTSASLAFWYKPHSEEAEWQNAKDEDFSWYNPADVITGRANNKDEHIQAANAPASAYARDWQEALILDSNYRLLAVVFRGVSNAGQWQRVEYDLTRFKGRTINIYFNVVNNGTGGRRTWMYVDQAAVYGCTGPQPPTVTPSPTVPPVPQCVERVLNGGFESDAVWQHPITPYRANYTTLDARTGARSMRHGTALPARDVYSHSSAYQSVVIPTDASSARLTYWFKPFTEETERLKVGEDWTDYDPGRVIRGESQDARAGKTTAGDYQEMLILDRNYAVLQTVMRLESNFGEWAQRTVDVTQYRGRRIVPYFNVFNDGDGRRTWMYVDDVSLEVCWPGSPAAATISGQVTLQGRPTWSDTVVGVDEMPCDQTGPNGTYACELAQDEPAASRLTAQHSGYLRAERTIEAGMSIQAPDVQLIAGDTNDDCDIDLFDLVIVAAAYDAYPVEDARADLNGDGVVDILDLVLVGGNYGYACPAPWTAPTAKTGASAEPASASVRLGAANKSGVVWAEVVVKGTDVYGVDVRLAFDPTRLAPVQTTGELGSFLAGAYIAQNKVDAQAGRAHLAATLARPAPAASGSGVVYRIPFRTVNSMAGKGAPAIRVERIKLVQQDATALEVK